MGCGSDERLRAKGKETKGLNFGLLLRVRFYGRSILRADWSENVPSAPDCQDSVVGFQEGARLQFQRKSGSICRCLHTFLCLLEAPWEPSSACSSSSEADGPDDGFLDR